jgi:DNA-binding beta-propeller fold protein YncE
VTDRLTDRERYEFLEIEDKPREDLCPPAFMDETDIDRLRDQRTMLPALTGSVLRVVEVIGRPGTDVGEFSEPRGMCLDQWGNLYVVDAGTNRVQKISPEGDVWVYSGAIGDRRASLKEPIDIAVDSLEMMYVLDRERCRVQKIGQDAEYQRTFAMPGQGRGQLWYPSGIAIDSRHTLYVADTWNRRVSVFGPNGRFKDLWRGQAVGGLDLPAGVGVTRDDEVVVCDTNNNRLVVLNREAMCLDIVEGWTGGHRLFTAPVDVAEDPFGSLWVVEANGHRLVKMSRDGTCLNAFGPELGGSLGSLGCASAICIRPDADMYVCDSTGGRVLRIGYRD